MPKPVHTAAWWRVMCLTGVDYFSTLAYQPSIAFVAAGTAVAARHARARPADALRRAADVLPRCRSEPARPGQHPDARVALPRWKGKAVVLILLGFAATSFVITITLSAADATAHLIENPLMPEWLHHPVLVTLALLLVLGAVFMRGFSEVIGLAVVIVAVYLLLNAVVIAKGISLIAAHPELLQGWRAALFAQHGSPVMMLAAAMIVFPKLALGLSGFETGVAVMPLVKGDPTDTEERPLGRIRNTKKLLLVAALIMSVLLMASSIITTVLIPGDLLVPGGSGGRARARVSRARASRSTLRHRLRHRDSRDALVRRGIGARRTAEPRAAISSALRHGARMGPREPPAHRHLHAHHVRRDHRVQCRRQRAGRRVCHRRARADLVRRCRRRHHEMGAAPPCSAVRSDCGHLPLHDVREHGRAPGGAEDRVDLHRDDHLHLAGVARASIDRASRARRRAGRGRVSLHRSRRAIRPDQNHRQSPGQRGSRRVRAQAERGARFASPRRRTSRCCSWRSGPETRRSSARCFASKGRRSRASGFSGARARRFRTRLRRCCSICATRRASFRTRTSDGRKAIPSRTC